VNEAFLSHQLKGSEKNYDVMLTFIWSWINDVIKFERELREQERKAMNERERDE
jgi:hypothetical protein